MAAADEKCVLCSKALSSGDTVTLSGKGAAGINKASKNQKSSLKVIVGQTVHISCRKDYTRNISSVTSEGGKRRSTRSREHFSTKEHCLLCGQPASLANKYKKYDVLSVRTADFEKTIKSTCAKRNDEWAVNVIARIEAIDSKDLRAGDVIYHRSCSVNFRTGKEIPQEHILHQPKKRKLRTGEIEKGNAFEKVIQSILKNSDVLTVKDAVTEMEKHLQNSDFQAYTVRYMKDKLKEYFGDKLTITDLSGRKDVLILQNTASEILYEFYKSKRSEDTEKQKKQIIETAAKLIENDIKLLQTNEDVYPPSTSMCLEESTDFFATVST